MTTKAGDFFKNSWKIIIIALAPLLIIAIIFALPLKTVPVQTTEKYWTTETQQQPYTATETYTEEEPYKATETRTETVLSDTAYSTNWSRTFTVDKPQSTFTVTLQNYGSYSYSYPYWYDSDSTYPRFYIPYWYGNYGGSKITIDVTYQEEVTKYRTVTKTRNVTKYREAQVQVEKERTTTAYVKKSLWAYLFD